MAKYSNPRHPKRPRDINALAAQVVENATTENRTSDEISQKADSDDKDSGKNPAAVALGRLGGKKGGKARAAKLSAERRREIAKKAAATRWGKEPSSERS